MEVVVGEYKLMAVPRSLMTADDKLISGDIGKADRSSACNNESMWRGSCRVHPG